jgi:hypothetical protein
MPAAENAHVFEFMPENVDFLSAGDKFGADHRRDRVPPIEDHRHSARRWLFGNLLQYWYQPIFLLLSCFSVRPNARHVWPRGRDKVVQILSRAMRSRLRQGSILKNQLRCLCL